MNKDELKNLLNDHEQIQKWDDDLKVRNPQAWERKHKNDKLYAWFEANQDEKWFRWCTSGACACIGCLQNAHEGKPNFNLNDYVSWLQWKYRELRKQKSAQ